MAEIRDQIIKALEEVTNSNKINLEFPENEEFGDYSSNVALVLARKKDKNPRELAETLVERLKEKNNLKSVTEKIEVAGPGFINFWLNHDVLVDNLIQIDSEFGTSDKENGKLAIVEYSSPNIAKPFTIGHLRSTVIGDAVANLLQATGWKVMRDNHLGDWGTQFGKMIYAIIHLGEGSKEKNIKKISSAENPVKELVKLYIEFHEKLEKISLEDGNGSILTESGDYLLQESDTISDEARMWFKKLEDGDKEAREIWQMCIDWSWQEFDRIYKILGVSFSQEFEKGRGLGESFFESRLKSVIDELEKNKLLKVGEEGAKLVFFKNDKYPPAMILKKDGATLYHTRDLATDKYRLEKYNPDLIINEVGSEQSLYFKQLFEIENLLGWFKDGQRIHVGHGLVRFKEGKMSTRKGNVVWMEDVLEEARNRASDLQKTRLIKDNKELHENYGNAVVNLKIGAAGKIQKNGDSVVDVVDQVAIGAIKFNDLKRDPKTDIVFDWDEVLNMEGNSGPYLQYTVARTNSVLTKSTFKGATFKGANSNLNNEEMILLRDLIRFPEIIEMAAKTYSPNLLCNFLYDLAQKFNGFYNADKILGSENEDFRLALTFGVGQVLKNGLKLLGIEAPERM